MDPMTFVRKMAEHYQTKMVSGQQKFVERIQQSISENNVVLIEADGGIGKTIGYLVCGMQKALASNLPLIVATSTITNRDQIQIEFDKIVAFAKLISDPIGSLPFFSIRSIRDYASATRLEAVIARLQRIIEPNSVVMGELYEIRSRLQAGAALLDEVIPYDISSGVEGQNVVVQRREIAAQSVTETDESFIKMRQDAMAHLDCACVLVMTQAMLAQHRQIHRAVAAEKVAMVVVDEVDKLTTMDFVTFTSLPLDSIKKLLDEAEQLIEVDMVRSVFDDLTGIVKDIKRSSGNKNNVILIYNEVGEKRVKTAYDAIFNIANALHDLTGALDTLTEIEPPTTLEEDKLYRRIMFEAGELSQSAYDLGDYFYPTGRAEWIAEKTETRIFLSWDDGYELRVVSARPGGVMAWLFRSTVRIPVLLTTAFLGEPENWFAQKIALPAYRLNQADAVHAEIYGKLKFIYFTGLHDPIVEDPQNRNRTPSPEHFDDIARILRFSPWSWEPGRRLLVLTPGYEDIDEIHRRLREGANPPIFDHRRGNNINELRDNLVRSDEGGILLTVYWEGFNIVGAQSGRRGLIDVAVISRIPFQRPNLMLEALHRHLGRQQRFAYENTQIEAKRRIHQGINRVIRGPDDKGVILFCDNRFPPPIALTLRYDVIASRPEYAKLVDAIPARFREDHECFELFDLKTMEMVPE